MHNEPRIRVRLSLHAPEILARRPRLDAEIGVGKAISILGPPGPRGGAKRQAVVRLIVAKLSLAAGR